MIAPAGGLPHPGRREKVLPGDVLDLDDDSAQQLIAAGRAVAAEQPAEPAPPPTPIRRRKPPAEDAFLNPDVRVSGNHDRI